jgi:hypothetical protein
MVEFLGAEALAYQKDGQHCCEQLELGSKAGKVFRYVHCLLEGSFDAV